MMNLMLIVSRDKNCIIPQSEVRKEFEYDEENVCFSDEAQDWIELLLMMNHSFSVDFYTESRKNAADFHNNLALRACGYGALAGG